MNSSRVCLKTKTRFFYSNGCNCDGCDGRDHFSNTLTISKIPKSQKELETSSGKSMVCQGCGCQFAKFMYLSLLSLLNLLGLPVTKFAYTTWPYWILSNLDWQIKFPLSYLPLGFTWGPMNVLITNNNTM